jgi:hypothetical protein
MEARRGSATAALDARRLAAGMGLGFALLYSARLCPDLCLIGDSAELVTAAASWGVPHPPGYPLYVLAAHLFTELPWGSVPWRVHLASAVFHGAAVAVAVAATFGITRHRIAAVVAGLALGLSRSFFLGSLYAEVFPLNDLFFAVLLALAFRLRAATGDRARPVVLLAFACGLASAHHMMIALAAPALAVLAARPFAEAVRGRPGVVVAAMGAFVAPVLLGGALILLAAARSPALSWGDVHDLDSLVHLMTRGDYGGLFSAARHPSAGPASARVSAFFGLFVASLGVPTLLLAALGLAGLAWRDWALGVALLLAIIVPGPLFAWANAIDVTSPETLAYVERFTTMAHLPVAIAAGAGVVEVARAVAGVRGWEIAAAFALGAWGLDEAVRTRGVDLRDDRLGIAFAHDLVHGTPDGALILLSGDAPTSAALYVCAVERSCGARLVLAPGTLSLPWRMAQFRRVHPDLRIPWTDGPALPRTHELVAAATARAAVFVYPDLIVKDPALSAPPFTAAPEGLLFRVETSAPAGGDPPRRFRTGASTMADGSCEGCRLLATGLVDARREGIAAHAYASAFANHAAVARALAAQAGPADAASLMDLARSFDARADQARAATWIHGEGSMSR